MVARAFGAKGVFIEGEDTHLIDSIKKATEVWGGSSYFKVETISDGKSLVSKWRNKGGIAIHLTMYGINVCEKIKEVSSFEVPLLIIVGSEKVDSWYYHNVDFNLAIGNQPHSEIAALAIFLDRLYKGLELHYIFEDSKLRVIPQEAGKKVVKNG
ncbi:tRNA methyltransferase [Sulfuracidifex metallicus]|uniref:tRNA methyltransferase n=1 Tax=Sulfuracidifex metallicus TaxID=47303 RepID=UPI002275E444|nr:tRNA methyltransferase [Sulfuracidifex metallicus]MCY0850819.1 tRNA methyltransferase [Sulfuracidifex metallicus]